jgi:hypothetical protein
MSAIIKNPLQRDGSSQRDRLLKALLPENAKIDDRQLADILSFVVEYSKELNYFNEQNKIDGDWSCFYESDPCILLALLATKDTDSIEAAFQQLAQKVNAVLSGEMGCGDDEQEIDLLPGYYDEIINLIFSLALLIQQSCKRLPEGHPLQQTILSIIRTDLQLAILDGQQQDALVKLIGYDKGSLAPLNNYRAFIQADEKACVCTKAWNLTAEGYDCIYPDNSFNLDSLKELFYVFFIALLKIKRKAKADFDICIEQNDTHQPHVSLLLSFLYLFQYAIDQLNSLTRSHLLYYYEQVLCLHKRKETPDEVHVVFEIAKNFHTHLVDEGVLLNAGKDDKGKQMVFAMLEEVVVNKAAIAELKTVYVNEQTGLVHAATNANTKNGIDESFAAGEQVQWRPLGGKALPTNELGFALASPMFFLSEGVRIGLISYRLQPHSTMDWLSMPDAFRLMYSANKEWFEVENIYDAIKRIVQNYPLLKQLYHENETTIKDWAVEMFGKIKTLYQDYYTGTKTKKVDKTKTVGKQSAAPDFESLMKFFEASDLSTLTQLLLASDAKAKAKDANAAALAIDRKVLQMELKQVRSEVLAIKAAFISNFDDKRNQLDFFFIANFNAPALTPLDVAASYPDIQSQWPVVKTLIRNKTIGNQVSNGYTNIKPLLLKGVDIKVAAYGMKNIVVQNDNAILDNSKEILPFSNRPYSGSYLYFGSKEVFQKKLDFVGVQLEWADKPSSFSEHYRNYGINTQNLSFTTTASLLNGGIYQDVFKGENQDLFNESLFGKTFIGLAAISGNDRNANDDKTGSGDVVLLKSKSNADALMVSEGLKSNASLQRDFDLGSFQRDPYMNDFTDYNASVQRGFMRLSLNQDFFHTVYPKAYTSIVARSGKALQADDLPNEPYTPKLKNTSLFYVSSEQVEFGPGKANTGIEQFFHTTPFGYERLSIDQQSSVFLLPQFAPAGESEFAQGNLYIGLSNALPEQKVNILFQIVEGTGDNRYPAPDVAWSYLINNQWVAFKPFEIQDHTKSGSNAKKSLLQSGIIEFSLPKGISSQSTTILDPALLWIRATATEDTTLPTDSDAMLAIPKIVALPDLTAVIAQAGIARFENKDNSLTHLAKPLPATTISKFIDSQAGIKKLEQPFYSFDGRLPEDDLGFYTRISERLRHKNRAICIWDYEHLILEAFPKIYKAKCLNHTGITSNLLTGAAASGLRLLELAPGYVTICVIPDLRNRNAINKVEPRVPVGTLDEVKAFLIKQTNLFLGSGHSETDPTDYLQVLNPLYEQLKVKTCVRFHDGLDVAFYKYQLNNDLKAFLSPWAFDENKEISFGRVYHRSAILNFIEERSYVDVVLGFDVAHYKDGTIQTQRDKDWIVPTTSRSVLTSYNTIDAGQEYEHSIEFVPYDEKNPCPDCVLIKT